MNGRCHKFEFRTEDEARSHLKKMKRATRQNKKLVTRLEVYQCHLHHVEAFHVGHNPFKTRKSARYERHRQLNGRA